MSIMVQLFVPCVELEVIWVFIVVPIHLKNPNLINRVKSLAIIVNKLVTKLDSAMQTFRVNSQTQINTINLTNDNYSQALVRAMSFQVVVCLVLYILWMVW